jgi:hypothetical protein
MAFLNLPILSGVTIKLCGLLGIDHRAYVVSLLRGFPDKFFEKLRHQPVLFFLLFVCLFVVTVFSNFRVSF